MSNPFRRVATKMATIIFIFSQLSVPARTTAARGSNAADKPFALREADPATRHRVSESYGKLPLSFEINRGQAGGDVQFLSRGAGYSLSLKSNEAELIVRNGEKPATVGMKFLGANPSPKIEGIEEQPGKSNYLIGNDPAKWRTNVPNYAKVRYAAVYPGIDLIFYGDQQQLEYDFRVAPGADPNVIALSFDGATRVSIARNGDLTLQTPGGEVRQRKPVIYQEVNGSKRAIAGRYVIRGKNRVGFEVAAYDRSKPLVIDPVIAYSARGFGGQGVAVDADGNAYVIGAAMADDFPAANRFGTADVFLAKLNPSGTAFLFTTYFGGNGIDTPNATAVDQAGNVFVVGTTNSTDLPATNNSFAGGSFFKTTDGGGAWSEGASGLPQSGINHLIVDPKNGSTLYASGYESLFKSADGGQSWFQLRNGLPSNSGPRLLAIDPINTSTLYAGYSQGVYKSTDGGDTWVKKSNGLSTITSSPEARNLVIDPVNPSTLYLSNVLALVYKSVDGGENWMEIRTRPPGGSPSVNALAVDPVTPNTLYAGVSAPDAIYISTDGGNIWSIINAGLPADTEAGSIAIAPNNTSTLYIGTNQGIYKSADGGRTWNASNSGFPASNARYYFRLPIVIDPVNPSTLYAAELNTGVHKSTDAGANWSRAGNGLSRADVITMAIDPKNPSTIYAATGGTTTDAFVLKLNPSGSAIAYSRYLGSGYEDTGTDIAVDGAGNAYVAGYTYSDNFPVTPNAFQTAFRGNRLNSEGNVFVAKLGASGSISYSTYLGGSIDRDLITPGTPERRPQIAVDAQGAIYVAGETLSKDFPLKNPLPLIFNSGRAFLAKLDASLAGEASLVYSVRIAPFTSQFVAPIYQRDPDVKVDGSGNVYLLSYNGVVGKLNSAATGFDFITDLGTGQGPRPGLNPPPSEGFRSLAIDSAGNAYVTGFTWNKDFPITPNAPQQGFASETCGLVNGTPVVCSEAFIVKLNPSGSTAFSTFLGGKGRDAGNGIAVDPAGNVYVAGTTDSADFPLTPGAFNFSSNGFLTKIAADDRGATVASVSAASYQAASLARESIVAGFGVNWAADTQSASGGVPASLAGVRVKINDSAGAARFAPLFFVSPGQINYQIPAGTADGEATATVFFGNIAVARGPLQIAAVAPGVFAANANGRGVAAAVAIRVKPDGSQHVEPVARFDASQKISTCAIERRPAGAVRGA